MENKKASLANNSTNDSNLLRRSVSKESKM